MPGMIGLGAAQTRRPWLSRYEPDRRAIRPAEHLRGFRGILQVDGYSGFEALGETGQVTLATCWAHWRRFYDLHQAGSPVATEALRRIAALYEVESRIRGQPPPQRQAARAEQTWPVVQALRPWLEAQLAQLPGRSGPVPVWADDRFGDRIQI